MKSAPILVFRTDWSRKVLSACADVARAEPDMADETGQLTGMVGIEVLVCCVELELVVELLVVVSTAAWISTVMVVVCVIEPLVPPT